MCRGQAYGCEGRISEARYNGVPYISKPTFQLHARTAPTERGKWRCFSLARLLWSRMSEQTGTWCIYSRETTHVEGEVIIKRKRLNGRRPEVDRLLYIRARSSSRRSCYKGIALPTLSLLLSLVVSHAHGLRGKGCGILHARGLSRCARSLCGVKIPTKEPM